MNVPLYFPSQTDGTRTPYSGAQAEPHNAEAERALLGAILLDPDILPHTGALVQPADFFLERHTLIYHCMRVVAQNGQRVDMVTLCAELEARNRLDFVGGSAYLTAMLAETPTARGYESYASLIRETAQRRRFVHRALDSVRIALNEKDVDVRQLVAEMQRELAGTESPTSAWTVQTLNTEDPADGRLEFVVDGLLPLPSLSIVFGAPGTLKSLLLADLMACVVAGKPWLATTTGDGRRTTDDGRRTMPVPALWIDLDNGNRRTRARFRALARGHDLPPDVPLYYVSMPTPTLDASASASADALIALAKDMLVGLIVIDNLALISGAVDENTTAMKVVMANLRRLAEATGAAVVVVHHERKANGLGGSSLERMRGNTAIAAALDLGLQVEREEGTDTIRLRSAKIRDFAVEPFAARWTYTHRADSAELETARFFGAHVAETGGKHGCDEAAVREAVVEALAAGPLKKTELVDKLHGVLTNIGEKRITYVVDAMIGGELKMTVKQKGAKMVELA